MYPRLFELPALPYLGQITVYSYGVLLAAAYLIGLQLAVIRARRWGLDATKVLDLGIYIIVAAIIGAKLLMLIVDFGYFAANPAELFTVMRSGGVFYGGLVLAVLVAFWYVRRSRLPVWATFDAFAPGIALGHAVGRLGCFMAGCCFGRPTDLPWGVRFSDPFAGANVGTPLGVDLHPTQLYEAGAELVIFGLLLATERRGRPFAGRTFWIYMPLYAVSRFIIEFYRGDERGVVFGILSTSQFISLVILPVSVVMLIRLARAGSSPTPARTAARRAGARAA